MTRRFRMIAAASRGALLACMIAAHTAGAGEQDSYQPSAVQQRVDLSFSDIPVKTRLSAVQSRLTELRVNDCATQGECDWRDAVGVRHYFWADEPFAYFVVVKSVRADEFAGRPIPVLGIGAARERARVLEAAQDFIPAAEFTCQPVDAKTQTCSAFLDPGWVAIRFDAAGMLIEIRFDAYHFT